MTFPDPSGHTVPCPDSSGHAAAGDLPSYLRDTGSRSRSITAENPTGAVGAGGSESSRLGPGRKGRPCIPIPVGESVVIADIEGPGVIRHLWFTLARVTDEGPNVLRNLVLVMTWDDAERPAVEVPIGDFFGCGFAEVAYQRSAAMLVAPNGGLNCYLPMPFASRARIELHNEHGGEVPYVFYQIDYSLEDSLPQGTMSLHAQWRRTNGDNALGEDHVILEGVSGPGSYVGTLVQLAQLERYWYGEGEVKFYIDDDDALPTIAGTGLEDYIGGAWAFQDHLGAVPPPTPQPFTALYAGYHQYVTEDSSQVSPYLTGMPPLHGMYRWHLPDPVRFTRALRVTLQQIGDRGGHLFERRDDIASVAYWYQMDPCGGSYRLPPVEERRPR